MCRECAHSRGVVRSLKSRRLGDGLTTTHSRTAFSSEFGGSRRAKGVLKTGRSLVDPRVKRAVANCPVVDWSILDEAEKAETSKSNYAPYIRDAFGTAYRLSDANCSKLRSGSFYNPWQHRAKISGSKLLMFHAKDGPNVPYERTKEFSELTGAALKSLARGGHISTDYVVRRYWPEIKKLFDSRR